ncbi:YegS/Rv2252/BmrU family lipid kinase [Gloeothece verrucosa]|uniref:Diacylglycerol kinase catalytic region n=1 Tax=Gloeothece verrucosa (strain PCC 7822) TaxID=497965 RepID=E0UA16_GLOV7|nr:YegS/Rv2252/BmrU family lipid kinase [Gloeothece verrucosa]ADN16208.1 diacylglycerol kinase catalytic region [Gloeothece verrucosa PCC 7822]
MTRSAYLIYNPTAGQGDPEQELQLIQSLLAPEFDLYTEKTTEEVDAAALAKDAIEKGFKTVIAAGGDGTISATAGVLINSHVAFGILPCGTANALASTLGIPPSAEEACQTILAGHTRIVDTATCNGQPMLLLAGVGFEADTIEGTNKQAKKNWGMLAYVFSGLRQLREFERFEAEIETDDKLIEVTAAAVTVANAAPATSILAQGPARVICDDGLLDVTIVAPKNRASAITASYHLLQTALQNEEAQRDDIGYLRTKRVKITTSPLQNVVVDGEVIGHTEIEVECIPHSLIIFVPATGSNSPPEKLENLPESKVETKTKAP